MPVGVKPLARGKKRRMDQKIRFIRDQTNRISRAGHTALPGHGRNGQNKCQKQHRQNR